MGILFLAFPEKDISWACNAISCWLKKKDILMGILFLAFP